MAQFCLHCGEENTYGKAVCPRCGTPAPPHAERASDGPGLDGAAERSTRIEPSTAAAMSFFFPGAGFAYCGAIVPALIFALVWWALPLVSNILAAVLAFKVAVDAARTGRLPCTGLAVGAALLGLKSGVVGLIVIVPLVIGALGLAGSRLW